MLTILRLMWLSQCQEPELRAARGICREGRRSTLTSCGGGTRFLQSTSNPTSLRGRPKKAKIQDELTPDIFKKLPLIVGDPWPRPVATIQRGKRVQGGPVEGGGMDLHPKPFHPKSHSLRWTPSADRPKNFALSTVTPETSKRTIWLQGHNSTRRPPSERKKKRKTKRGEGKRKRTKFWAVWRRRGPAERGLAGVLAEGGAEGGSRGPSPSPHFCQWRRSP